jgi:uncharacterized membrane protein YczE
VLEVVKPSPPYWPYRRKANPAILAGMATVPRSPLARLPLRPLPPDRLGLRVAVLLGGLVLHGVSGGLLLVAGLGADPWNVLHQGLARVFGGQVGTWTIIVGALALLGWIPLRQRPGVGTLCNVVLIGLATNATLSLLHTPTSTVARVALMTVACVLYAVATGAYIGAGLGPGPRDGLMTGFVARGHSIRLVRSVIELSVLGVGWALGGTVGIGTLLFAVAVGPLVHWTIPALAVGRRASAGRSVPDPVGQGA